MSNNMKKFIWDNRDEFDNLTPPEKVWNTIGSTMKRNKPESFNVGPIFKWGIAATLLILAATATYFIVVKNDITEPALSKTIDSTNADLATVAPDYAPQMNQFAKLIETRQEELKLLSKEQPRLYQKFTTDMIQLDSSYYALKSQLNISPNRELLLEAMIQNLQLQLSVLNQQVYIIHQIKQSKKYSHEKNNPVI